MLAGTEQVVWLPPKWAFLAWLWMCGGARPLSAPFLFLQGGFVQLELALVLPSYNAHIHTSNPAVASAHNFVFSAQVSGYFKINRGQMVLV